MLHAIRIVFPLTQMIKYSMQIRIYLSLLNDTLTEPEKNRTIGFTSFVCLIMLCSSLWYNLIRPFYYIIHLNAAAPTKHMHDKYLPAVYYTTMVLNEMTFCLFLGMAYIIISFDKVFKTRRFKVLNQKAYYSGALS